MAGPWVKKCCKLTARPPSAPQAYQCKIIQSTGMATQMQLKVFNIWKEIVWPPRLLERKNNKVVSFSTLFFMFTLSWITEKERVIENKRDEFCRKKNMKIQGGCETIGTL